ncbi:hypothetical protein [Tenacibaculum jejuense]|uniref:Uncharacterized protein n=1 Tax=Tenacibaculum jejuense TaxID=584609 RepID=A0A238U5P9_9FLAO|nr:hypothetical protein [Tenacibaculum jejuense]SNR13938.1 protein of unknown function [Tenacibaculum jejuense]
MKKYFLLLIVLIHISCNDSEQSEQIELSKVPLKSINIDYYQGREYSKYEKNYSYDEDNRLIRTDIISDEELVEYYIFSYENDKIVLIEYFKRNQLFEKIELSYTVENITKIKNSTYLSSGIVTFEKEIIYNSNNKVVQVFSTSGSPNYSEINEFITDNTVKINQTGEYISGYKIVKYDNLNNPYSRIPYFKPIFKLNKSVAEGVSNGFFERLGIGRPNTNNVIEQQKFKDNGELSFVDTIENSYDGNGYLVKSSFKAGLGGHTYITEYFYKEL